MARLWERSGQGPGTVVLVQFGSHVANVRNASAIQRLRTRAVRGPDGGESRHNDSQDDEDCGHRDGSREAHDVCFGGSIVSK